MYKIHIPNTEFFDNDKNQFVYINKTEIVIEHSLISISKWEAKWHKPFLSDKPKTTEETIDYIKQMTISKNVDPLAYLVIPDKELKKVMEYIDDPHSATTFSEKEGHAKSNKEVITSELIYYWMVASTIPMECEKWHLNRLLTLIRICGIKNQPPKKMSKRSIMSKNRALNAARRKQLGTNG